MFIITKILGFLLSPFLWVLVMTIITALKKDPSGRKKWAKWTAIVVLFFSNPFIINNLQYPFQAKPEPMKPGEQVETGIVLGGMTSFDRVAQKGYFNQSSDRFIQIALLYKKGHIKRIVACGGQNGFVKERNFTEAGFIKSQLTDLGIPDSAILMEDRSRNTIENARFAKEILERNGIANNRIILVTSAFHMPRAAATFEKAGFSVRPFPAVIGILESETLFSLGNFIPSTGAMEGWGQFLKESVGRLYLSLTSSLT
jgi:uncharacterized SAM-binding protein YcdF (DUF218 family)